MSTETPKTDGMTQECREYYDMGGHGIAQPFKAADGECVPADFARALERENAELRGKLERLAAYWEEADTERQRRCAEELRAILNEGSK